MTELQKHKIPLSLIFMNFCTLKVSKPSRAGSSTMSEVVLFFLLWISLFHAFALIFVRTSEENMVAQVPMHQHTTGLVIRPSLIPLQILYSSVPPICRERDGSQLHF